MTIAIIKTTLYYIAWKWNTVQAVCPFSSCTATAVRLEVKMTMAVCSSELVVHRMKQEDHGKYIEKKVESLAEFLLEKLHSFYCFMGAWEEFLVLRNFAILLVDLSDPNFKL